MGSLRATGLSVRQIAVQVGISKSSVGSLLSRKVNLFGQAKS